VLGVKIGALLWNILPLAIFSAIIAAGLVLCPDRCVKIFGVFGAIIKIVITIGLGLALFRFLTGAQIVPGLGTLEDAAAICLNASAVMAGAFPLLFVVSKILNRPMQKLGQKLGVNETSVMGLVSSLANSITTFEMMDSMDKRGAMLNAAFAVPAAFVLADHLAFTLAFDPGCLSAMMIGKLTAGLLAVALAMILSKNEKTSA
jgi:ethanolamine transporter